MLACGLLKECGGCSLRGEAPFLSTRLLTLILWTSVLYLSMYLLVPQPCAFPALVPLPLSQKTCWSMNCLPSGLSRYLTSASPPRSRLTSFSTRLSGLLFTLLRRSSGVAAIRVPVTFGLWV